LENTIKNFELRSIEIQSVDVTKSGKVLFIKLSSDIYQNGNKVPGIVLLRNNCIAMLPVLKTSSGRTYVVLVGQARVASGEATTYEIPAGIIEEGESLREAVIRELYEETTIEVCVYDDFGPLSDPLYTSVGILNEAISIYHIEKRVDDSYVENLKRITTGEPSENEYIKLALIDLDEDNFFDYTSDMKSVLAYIAYQHYFGKDSK
jgi:8-oxo-dGTP pyrophosphatase MutT (NUDIX family)